MNVIKLIVGSCILLLMVAFLIIYSIKNKEFLAFTLTLAFWKSFFLGFFVGMLIAYIIISIQGGLDLFFCVFSFFYIFFYIFFYTKNYLSFKNNDYFRQKKEASKNKFYFYV